MAEPAKKLEPVETKVPEESSSRLMSPFEEMERWFEGMFPRSLMHPLHWDMPTWSQLHRPFEGKAPRVDVIDRDAEVFIKAELPGVDKKDIDLTVDEQSVTIKGHTHYEKKEEKGDYYRSEVSSGSYMRTIPLPAKVVSDQAKAKYTDGMLELTLPKVSPSSKRSVTIE